MSQKTPEIKSGATVELADKETSFYDPATELKIVRDGQAKLGKNIGSKTNTAIMSGRLLVVGETKKTSSETAEKSDLPDDLPGRDAFIAAKMNFDAVKSFDFETGKVAGVGKQTIEQLQTYLKK